MSKDSPAICKKCKYIHPNSWKPLCTHPDYRTRSYVTNEAIYQPCNKINWNGSCIRFEEKEPSWITRLWKKIFK